MKILIIILAFIVIGARVWNNQHISIASKIWWTIIEWIMFGVIYYCVLAIVKLFQL